MDVYSLPETETSQKVKLDFLKHLSMKVDISEISKQMIQIIIFLPVSRPLDEFSHIMSLFNQRGGRENDDIIFISAMKSHQSDFHVPRGHRMVFTETIYVSDEGCLESNSLATIDRLANFLVDKFGLKLISQRETVVEPGTAKVKERETKGPDHLQTQDENRRLRCRVKDLEKEILEVKQEKEKSEKHIEKDRTTACQQETENRKLKLEMKIQTQEMQELIRVKEKDQKKVLTMEGNIKHLKEEGERQVRKIQELNSKGQELHLEAEAERERRYNQSAAKRDEQTRFRDADEHKSRAVKFEVPGSRVWKSTQMYEVSLQEIEQEAQLLQLLMDSVKRDTLESSARSLRKKTTILSDL